MSPVDILAIAKATAAVLSEGRTGAQLQSLTFKVGANQQIPISVSGDYVYIDNVTADASTDITPLKLKPDRGTELPVAQLYRGNVFPVPFTRMEVQNPNAFEVTVSLMIGFGRVQNDAPANGIVVKPAVQVVSGTAIQGAAPYAVNDCVGAGIVVANSFADWATKGVIRRARLMKNGLTVANTQFKVFLYQATGLIPGPFVDGNPFELDWDEADVLQGVIDFPVMETFGAGSDSALCDLAGLDVPVNRGTGSTSLYCVIVAMQAYAPGAGETFRLDLWIEQA